MGTFIFTFYYSPGEFDFYTFVQKMIRFLFLIKMSIMPFERLKKNDGFVNNKKPTKNNDATLSSKKSR